MGKAVSKVFSPVAKAVTNVTKAVVQPVYNATLKQIPGVDNALVGLDKAVGSTIPGGWGTVASIAASFIPGAQFGANGLLSGITRTQLATGLGALSGSGVMRKGHEFNLQGAIMGGAMAYGGAKLAEGLQAAGSGSAAEAAEKALASDTARIASNMGVEGAATGANSQAAMLANQTAGMEAIPRGFADAIPKGAALEAANSGLANADVFSGLAGTQGAVPQAIIPQPSGLANLAQAGSETLSNMGQAGQGIANMTGFGPDGISGISGAVSRFAEPITMKSMTAGIVGAGGLMAIEEQKKMLAQQLAQGTIAQSEYNAALAEINRQEQFARETVAANPFRTDTDVSGSLSGSGGDSSAAYDTLYASTPSRAGVYARGGEVQHYFGGGLLGGSIRSIMGAIGALKDIEAQKAEQNATSVGTETVKNNPWLPSITADKPTITIGIGSLNRGKPDDLLYDNSPRTSKSLDYGLPKYALGGVIADDYSGAGPLDQGFNFNYPQQNQVNSNYPSPSNFDRPQSGPTTPSSYYQNTGLDSFGGYGSGMGYAAGGYAMGGEPRFLSGGGDGMSDSIRANINGNQEARLADGEFVIPADVVSHLGNGSSKAGAKQLYTMMDRARKARTGRKSQGKQINPRKYMPA